MGKRSVQSAGFPQLYSLCGWMNPRTQNFTDFEGCHDEEERNALGLAQSVKRSSLISRTQKTVRCNGA